MKKKENLSKNIDLEQDPFFALKYIAFCRTQMPPENATISEEDLVEWAKWQICRERGLLFLDPTWDKYGPEDVLVEYFSLSFDTNTELRDAFKAILTNAEKKEDAWFADMEAKYLKKKEEEIKAEVGEIEFEDKF